MVKKSPKAAEPQQGWASSPPPNPADDSAGAPGNGNISDNPEDRRPMDEGWNETIQQQTGANAHGLGPDEGKGPNPDYVPPVDPAPAEPAKPKRKGKAKGDKAADVPTAQGNVTKNHNSEGGRLVSIVERIERLAEEKKTIADDMKEVFAEAKAEGYDTATIRKVLQRRRLGKDAVDEMDAILDLYESQVGFD